MTFYYETIYEIGMNFGKKFIYGIKITNSAFFVLYNFVYDLMLLSKPEYKKTKNIIKYGIKNHFVFLPGDIVSINNYDGGLENKWTLLSIDIENGENEENEDTKKGVLIHILEHVSVKGLIVHQVLDNIKLI